MQPDRDDEPTQENSGRRKERLSVLFVMHYPGYLRYFDSTIRELVDRGHHVRLAFDKLNKQEEGLVALEGVVSGDDIGTFPRRDDAWSVLAIRVRRVVDYARYLHPDFADAQPLRERVQGKLPRAARALSRAPTLGPKGFTRLLRILHLLERAIPTSERTDRFVRACAPDVVVVSPLVASAARQTELVKSARAQNIPTVLAVASWDHLTTKGLIRVMPDRVLVWNECQRSEAIRMHGVPESKIAVTGAQPFDRWFDRAPSTGREEFCRKVGLSPGKQFVLFVGSTASISAPDAEKEFVRRWICALRQSDVARLCEADVLVRPHPYNSGHWHKRELADFRGVAVYPRHAANPVDEADRADYFDSIFHSAAVVGINTSAMIEAAVIGRPVHTIVANEFSDTQVGTLHFRYLIPENGGFVQIARSIEEHVSQLGTTLSDPEAVRAEQRRFVESFVRPCGLDEACTPRVADAIEATALTAKACPEQNLGERVVRAVAGLPVLVSAGVVEARRGQLRKFLRKLFHHYSGHLLRFAYGNGSFGRERLARAARNRDRARAGAGVYDASAPSLNEGDPLRASVNGADPLRVGERPASIASPGDPTAGA